MQAAVFDALPSRSTVGTFFRWHATSETLAGLIEHRDIKVVGLLALVSVGTARGLAAQYELFGIPIIAHEAPVGSWGLYLAVKP